jgi:hypothetical protein
MDNGRRRELERAFYDYQKNRMEAAEYISDLCSTKSPVLENLGHGSGISDPTALSGVKLAEYKKYLWCEVVEKTCTTFRFEYEYELIKLRYFNHISRNSVISYLNVSERTYCYWLDRVLITAERWAYELGIYADER